MEEKYNQLKEEKDELQIEYSELKNKNNLVESEQDPIIQGGGDIGWGDGKPIFNLINLSLQCLIFSFESF
jgi:hypothetical protein